MHPDMFVKVLSKGGGGRPAVTAVCCEDEDESKAQTKQREHRNCFNPLTDHWSGNISVWSRWAEMSGNQQRNCSEVKTTNLQMAVVNI